MFIPSRAGSFAFFTLYIHSFIFFFAFAAPVSITPLTAISVPSYNPYTLDKPLALSGSLTKRDPLPSPSVHGSSQLAARSLREPEIQTLVRRKSIFTKIKDAFKKVGSGIKKGFQKIGQGIKTVAKKIGQGIKTAAKKVGQGIKTAAKKVGQGIKTAAKKVGKFIKTTGAKIAKFGLKVISTAQSIGAKLAGFIPGIGKPIGKALKAASMATNAISDKIHVSLGSKLDKGMKIMDKIRNPVSGAGGKILDAVLRREEDDEWIFHRELDDLVYGDVYTRGYDDLEERGDVDFEPWVQ